MTTETETQTYNDSAREALDRADQLDSDAKAIEAAFAVPAVQRMFDGMITASLEAIAADPLDADVTTHTSFYAAVEHVRSFASGLRASAKMIRENAERMNRDAQMLEIDAAEFAALVDGGAE